MKTLKAVVLRGCIVAVVTMIAFSHASAQRDLDFTLHTQTMFDWYVASPDDKKATALAVIAQIFMPNSSEDFAKLVRATEFLVACIDQHSGGSGSAPVAKFAELCVAEIEVQDLLK